MVFIDFILFLHFGRYVKVGGQRFPSNGHITMRANETFTAPDPKPLLVQFKQFLSAYAFLVFYHR
jgi:hypothetical protein